MTYYYGGHLDYPEHVYWLDEHGVPVARIRFVEFERVCKYGDSDGGPVVSVP